MPKHMSQGDAIEMAALYFPSFLESRRKALQLTAWREGRQYEFSEDMDEDDRGYGRAYAPERKGASREYENLRSLSPNNFGGAVVNSMAQTAYLEGIRRPGVEGSLPVWQTFLRNRWDSRQTAVHRSALGDGLSYGVVLPGVDPLTGSKMSKMLGKSATSMAAFYSRDDDEWPVLAIEGHRTSERNSLGLKESTGWFVEVYDDYVIHRLSCKGDGVTEKDWTYIDYFEHGLPIVPVARCANRLDLDGNAVGEIEPVLPLLRRLDQDLFDRLINQRFGAWQVRYIAGMAKPTGDAQAEKFRLSMEDILVSTDAETKFGTLPAGDIENQIKVTDADLRLLSAVTQMPPHHLLGLSSNLQAEALAAAEAGLQRRSFDFRVNAGQFHEQMARLVAMSEGDFATAAAWDLQVRWRDTESRSFAQATQALGILATQLQVPIEMLWERIPGWTDTDVQRAKELVESGSFEALIRELGMVDNAGDAPAAGVEDTGGVAK